MLWSNCNLFGIFSVEIQCQCKAAFTLDATDCGTTAAPENRNMGIQRGRLHGDMPACSRHDCCETGRQFKFELKIAARHRLSRAVFFEGHQPQKLPIHGLYAGVARDSCLPCKCYCCAASRAAKCRTACCVPCKHTLRCDMIFIETMHPM